MTADDLAKILDELGKRLGPTGQAAWNILVQQKINEASAYLGAFHAAGSVLGALFSAFIITMIVKLAIRENAKRKMKVNGFGYYGGDNDAYYYLTILAVVVGILWAIIQLVQIDSTLQAQNPQYYALRDIIQSVK